jgi:ElaB/YqjD/DUF883 family membrane-anchored ribosome-binding protein
MGNTTVKKDELLNEFQAVVADTEQLLKSVASASGEKAQTLREGVEQNLKAAKARLQEIEQAAVAKAKEAATATDKYVHVHPWTAIGIAAALAGFAGLVVGLLIGRR